MPKYIDILKNEQIRLIESKEAWYKLYTFTPVPLGRVAINIDDKLFKLLIEAHSISGEVKGMSKHIESNGFFVSLSKISESIASCKIDNINVGFIDLITKKKGAEKFDIEKANNYAEALNAFKSYPFSRRCLCALHKKIISTDEIEYWESKQNNFLGNIRTIQSFLYLEKGVHVVNELRYNPTPPESLGNLLDEMFYYYENNTKYDILIKLALVHYQFESLHPFLGGNGRIGRLLIPKILIDNHLIDKCVLTFSEFLAQNRMEYFDRLWNAQVSRNLTQWVEYFLNGIVNSARLAIERINIYCKLMKREMDLMQINKAYSEKLLLLHRHLTQYYIIDTKTVCEKLNVSFNTANKLVGILCEYGILRPLNDQKRYRVYMYSMVGELLG